MTSSLVAPFSFASAVVRVFSNTLSENRTVKASDCQLIVTPTVSDPIQLQLPIEAQLEPPTRFLPGRLVLRTTAGSSADPSHNSHAATEITISVSPRSWDDAVLLTEFLQGERTLTAPEDLAPASSAASAATTPVSANQDVASESQLPAPEDFVAFDVETANDDYGSICQIGLAVVRAGEITEEYSWLCQPPEAVSHFDSVNIAVHGITANDVADAPTFEERLGELKNVVGELPMVAHNAKFDFTALQRACQLTEQLAPRVKFACTFLWARRTRLGLPNLKLPTLAAAAGYELTQHHDATADARACAKIALWLFQKLEASSCEELSRKLGLPMGELSPERLKLIFAPRGTSKRNQQRKWDAVATPAAIPKANKDADPQGALFGQRVTLTGDFEPHDKGTLWQHIAAAGADINKSVTKKTTILVVGDWHSVTSKEKRARELQEQGQEIEIWSKEKLYAALENLSA